MGLMPVMATPSANVHLKFPIEAVETTDSRYLVQLQA
jgi:hypothetical protein